MIGKIYYILGKSAAGKDTLYRNLLADPQLALTGVVPYTTRPMRDGETDGREYFFIDDARMEALWASGRVIESRTYRTVLGPWTYATLDDGAIDLEEHSYLMAGTLESYGQTLKYYGADRVVPLYVEVEPGLRLFRALARERSQAEPKYAEMCRRFLADEEDFSPEKQAAFHFPRKYMNDDFDTCLGELADTIEKELQ